MTVSIGRLPAADRPGLASWTVSTTDARDALEKIGTLDINADDIGRVCRVGDQEPFAYFELIGVAPLAWAAIGGGVDTGSSGGSAAASAANYVVSLAAPLVMNDAGTTLFASAVMPDLPGTFTLDLGSEKAVSAFYRYASEILVPNMAIGFRTNGIGPLFSLGTDYQDIALINGFTVVLKAGDTIDLAASAGDTYGNNQPMDGSLVAMADLNMTLTFDYDPNGTGENAVPLPANVSAQPYPGDHVSYSPLPYSGSIPETLSTITLSSPAYPGVLPNDADGNPGSASLILGIYERADSNSTVPEPGALIESQRIVMAYDEGSKQNRAVMTLNSSIDTSDGRDFVLAILPQSDVFVDSIRDTGLQKPATYADHADDGSLPAYSSGGFPPPKRLSIRMQPILG